MAKRFAEITFTPSVKAAQTRYGSRAANEGFELSPDPGDTLGPAETAFLEARDGFIRRRSMKTDGPMCRFEVALPDS